MQVLGRNELHITWEPPEVPLGRITRYDVLMNGKIIYSGTELSHTVRRLTPDTEYSFVVSDDLPGEFTMNFSIFQCYQCLQCELQVKNLVIYTIPF